MKQKPGLIGLSHVFVIPEIVQLSRHLLLEDDSGIDLDHIPRVTAWKDGPWNWTFGVFRSWGQEETNMVT